MADKGVTIPVNLVVDEQGFAERLVQATSKSGKKMEKNLNQALVSAFNVEAAYKQAKQALAEIGKLPVDPSTGKQLSEKDFAALEKSAKKATAYIEAYNKMQEEANKMQMVTSKKGLTPVLTEKAQDITKPIEQYESRLKDIKSEIAEIVSMQKDIDLYEENKSILTDRSQMVDMEVDIIDKYEKQQKILESSIKAQETIKQQIRDYNAELEKAHPKDIPNATNMKKWGARSILDDPKLKSFETRAANAQARMNEMEEAYKKAKQLIDLRDRLAEKGFIDEESGQAVQNLDKWFSQSVQDIAQLNNETNNLNSAIHEINAELSNMPVEDKYKLIGVSDEDVNKVNDLAAAFSATANSAQDAVDFMEYGITATQKAADEKQKEKEQAAALKQQIKEAKEAEKQAAEQSRAWRKAVDNVKGSFTRILGTLRKVLTGLRQFGRQSKTSFNEGQPPLKKMFNLVLRFGFGIRSIFFLVKRLKKTIVDDFNVMAQSIPEVNKQLSELSTSWLKLKATLGTLAQPLLQYFGPAINWIINKVQELMIVWAKFIALLTGQKYIYTAETAMVDYAESLGDAAGAAKELNKQLAPFDKLNVLNSDNNKSGGSGSSPTEINTDNVNYIKEAIADIENIFYEMGKRLATFFNNFMDSLDWEHIKAKAKEYATDITDFIMGFVDNFNFEQFGQTLAEGVNTIFTFLKTFVDRTPWGDIGKGIADAIMGFFTTTDFDQIADTIAGAINGLGSLVSNLLEFTDFNLIGEKIGGFLQRLIDEIDWELLGQNLKNLIAGLADIVVGLLKKVDFESIGEKISTLLKELFTGKPNILSSVGEAFWECLKSAIDIHKGIWEDNPVAGLIIDGILAAITIAKVTPLVTSLATIFGTAATTGAGATAIATACNPIGLAIAAAIAAGIAGYGLGKMLGDLIFSEDNPLVPKDVEKFMNVGQQASDALVEGFQQKTDLLNAILDSQSTAEGRAALEKYIEGIFNGVSRDTLYSIGEKVDWEAVFNVPGMKLVSDNMVYAGNKIITKADQARTKLELLGVSADNLGNTFAYEGPKIVTFADALKNFISKNTSGRLIDLLGGVTNAMTVMGSTMLDDDEIIAQSMDNIINSTSSMGASVSGTLQQISTNTNFTTQAFSLAAKDMASTSSGIKTTFSSLSGALRTAFNGIIGGSEKMGNSVTDGINQATDSLNNFRFTLPSWVPGIGGQTLSFSIPRLNRKISIPRLAQGGVIPANNEFLAVLGDQKQGTNIEAPLDTIKQAVAEVMSQMNNSSDNGEIVINIDGYEVFRVIREQDRVFKKSTGKSAFA